MPFVEQRGEHVVDPPRGCRGPQHLADLAPEKGQTSFPRGDASERVPHRIGQGRPCSRHQTPNRMRQRCERAPEPWRVQIPVIAPEQLVAAITRQRDGDVRAGERTHQMRGERGAVRERLAVHFRQLRDDRDRLGRADVHLVMLGAEMRGDLSRVHRLVEARFLETDREGPDRAGRRSLVERDDRRGIEPARQERTDRHVGDRLSCDRGRQRRLDRLDRLGFARIGVRQPVAHDVAVRPVAGQRRAILHVLGKGCGAGMGDRIGRERQHRRRRQLVDALVDRLRTRNVGARQQRR